MTQRVWDIREIAMGTLGVAASFLFVFVLGFVVGWILATLRQWDIWQ